MNRSFAMLAVMSVGILGSRDGMAREPTKAECLASSEASLKSGSDHKLRAERAQLLVCAATTCPKVIRKECAERVAEVNAQIPTILIVAKDTTGADLTQVQVTMDGEVLADHLDGTALAVDPGEHVFKFETAGQPTLSRTFLIEEGQKDRREVVTIGVPIAPAPAPAAEVPPAPATTWRAQRTAALVAAGVGVAGIGLGAAFGAVAISDKSAAASLCPSATCGTSAGVDKWNSAASAGNVATVGFIVGGAAIVGAAILWFVAPHPKAASAVQVGLAPGAVVVRGAW